MTRQHVHFLRGALFAYTRRTPQPLVTAAGADRWPPRKVARRSGAQRGLWPGAEGAGLGVEGLPVLNGGLRQLRREAVHNQLIRQVVSQILQKRCVNRLSGGRGVDLPAGV